VIGAFVPARDQPQQDGRVPLGIHKTEDIFMQVVLEVLLVDLENSIWVWGTWAFLVSRESSLSRLKERRKLSLKVEIFARAPAVQSSSTDLDIDHSFKGRLGVAPQPSETPIMVSNLQN